MNSNFMKTLVFSATVALLLGGCASMGGGASGVEILASGNHSDMQDQQYVDIHKQADFDVLWQKTFANLSSVPSKPAVDFSKNMVLAAFIGTQNHGGYLIRIVNIDASGATVQVTAEVTIPGTNCRYTQSKTEPFLFVTAPATNKPVNFNLTQRNAPACG